MFEQFPKTREPLPPRMAEIYSQHYRSNRDGTTKAASLAQKMEAWLHKQVAADVVSDPATRRTTLEIGAGTLNQIPFEPAVGDYDVIEPMRFLYADSPHRDRVRTIYDGINEIPADARYDRITSVAVLEHVCELPDLVARSGVLLAEGGSFRASIPNEGTFLWKMGYRLTTGIEFRLRYGMDYEIMMRHEHVNTAREIEEVLEHFFTDTRCRVFGLCKAVGLYRFYECRNPDLGRCRAWLDRHADPKPPPREV